MSINYDEIRRIKQARQQNQTAVQTPEAPQFVRTDDGNAMDLNIARLKMLKRFTGVDPFKAPTIPKLAPLELSPEEQVAVAESTKQAPQPTPSLQSPQFPDNYAVFLNKSGVPHVQTKQAPETTQEPSVDFTPIENQKYGDPANILRTIAPKAGQIGFNMSPQELAQHGLTATGPIHDPNKVGSGEAFANAIAEGVTGQDINDPEVRSKHPILDKTGQLVGFAGKLMAFGELAPFTGIAGEAGKFALSSVLTNAINEWSGHQNKEAKEIAKEIALQTVSGAAFGSAGEVASAIASKIPPAHPLFKFALSNALQSAGFVASSAAIRKVESLASDQPFHYSIQDIAFDAALPVVMGLPNVISAISKKAGQKGSPLTPEETREIAIEEGEDYFPPVDKESISIQTQQGKSRGYGSVVEKDGIHIIQDSEDGFTVLKDGGKVFEKVAGDITNGGTVSRKQLIEAGLPVPQSLSTDLAAHKDRVSDIGKKLNNKANPVNAEYGGVYEGNDGKYYHVQVKPSETKKGKLFFEAVQVGEVPEGKKRNYYQRDLKPNEAKNFFDGSEKIPVFKKVGESKGVYDHKSKAITPHPEIAEHPDIVSAKAEARSLFPKGNTKDITSANIKYGNQLLKYFTGERFEMPEPTELVKPEVAKQIRSIVEEKVNKALTEVPNADTKRQEEKVQEAKAEETVTRSSSEKPTQAKEKVASDGDISKEIPPSARELVHPRIGDNKEVSLLRKELAKELEDGGVNEIALSLEYHRKISNALKKAKEEVVDFSKLDKLREDFISGKISYEEHDKAIGEEINNLVAKHGHKKLGEALDIREQQVEAAEPTDEKPAPIVEKTSKVEPTVSEGGDKAPKVDVAEMEAAQEKAIEEFNKTLKDKELSDDEYVVQLSKYIKKNNSALYDHLVETGEIEPIKDAEKKPAKVEKSKAESPEEIADKLIALSKEGNLPQIEGLDKEDVIDLIHTFPENTTSDKILKGWGVGLKIEQDKPVKLEISDQKKLDALRKKYEKSEVSDIPTDDLEELLRLSSNPELKQAKTFKEKAAEANKKRREAILGDPERVAAIERLLGIKRGQSENPTNTETPSEQRGLDNDGRTETVGGDGEETGFSHETVYGEQEQFKNDQISRQLTTARSNLTAFVDYTLNKTSAVFKRIQDMGLAAEHQLQGIQKLYTANKEMGGFYNADGTGAGKTTQILASAHIDAEEGKTVIIITANAAIKPKWRKGEYSGSFMNDSNRMKLKAPRLWKFTKGATIRKGEVIITTYENLRELRDYLANNDVGEISTYFDEAHAFINSGSRRAKMGVDIMGKSKYVNLFTATPLDKPIHIPYMFRTGILEGRDTDTALTELGLKKSTDGAGNVTWGIGSGRGDEANNILTNIENLFDRMTEKGHMIRREVKMDNVSVNIRRVNLPARAHLDLADIDSFIREVKKGAKANGIILMHQQRQQEQYKVKPTANLIKEELDSGRQVIVFVQSTKKSQVGRWVTQKGKQIYELLTRPDGSVVEREGTAKLMREELEKLGITNISELHGESKQNPKEAIDNFNSGVNKVLIATEGSGGVGINLDDVIGDAPRTVIKLDPSKSAIQSAQNSGRATRVTTKSDVKYIYILSDNAIDGWATEILFRKEGALESAVKGEVSGASLGVAEDSQPTLEQKKTEDVRGKTVFDVSERTKLIVLYKDVKGKLKNPSALVEELIHAGFHEPSADGKGWIVNHLPKDVRPVLEEHYKVKDSVWTTAQIEDMTHHFQLYLRDSLPEALVKKLSKGFNAIIKILKDAYDIVLDARVRRGEDLPQHIRDAFETLVKEKLIKTEKPSVAKKEAVASADIPKAAERFKDTNPNEVLRLEGAQGRFTDIAEDTYATITNPETFDPTEWQEPTYVLYKGKRYTRDHTRLKAAQEILAGNIDGLSYRDIPGATKTTIPFREIAAEQLAKKKNLDVSKLSDEEVFDLIREYGENANRGSQAQTVAEDFNSFANQRQRGTSPKILKGRFKKYYQTFENISNLATGKHLQNMAVLDMDMAETSPKAREFANQIGKFRGTELGKEKFTDAHEEEVTKFLWFTPTDAKVGVLSFPDLKVGKFVEVIKAKLNDPAFTKESKLNLTGAEVEKKDRYVEGDGMFYERQERIKENRRILDGLPKGAMYDSPEMIALKEKLKTDIRADEAEQTEAEARGEGNAAPQNELFQKKRKAVDPFHELLKFARRSTLSTAESVNDARKWSLKALLPAAASEGHKAAAIGLGSELGWKNHFDAVSKRSLLEHNKEFIRDGVDNRNIELEDNAGIRFMSAMSKDGKVDKKYQIVADKMNSIFEQLQKELTEAGASIRSVRENYFPGIWTKQSIWAFGKALREHTAEHGGMNIDFDQWTAENKRAVRDRAEELLDEGVTGQDDTALEFFSKRPLKGKESFRKQKSFDDIMTAIEFGLKPVSTNPVDIFMLKHAEITRAVMMERRLSKLEKSGMKKFIPSEIKIPKGWSKVPDKNEGAVFGPPELKTKEYVDKSILDALTKTAENLGVTHERKTSLGRANKLGLAYDFGRVYTKANTELGVLAHEIGHELDYKYDLWTKIVKEAEVLSKKGKVLEGKSAELRSVIQKELRSLADLKYEGQDASDSYKRYVRKKVEKIAQMVESYVQMPERFKEVAPNVYSAFKEFLDTTPELQPLKDIKPGINYTALENTYDLGGFPIIGYHVIPTAEADVMKNYMSKSLYNSPGLGGGLFRAYMGLANALNQSQLGIFSAFHAGFTTGEAVISSGAMVLKNLYGIGVGNRTAKDLAGSVKDLSWSPIRSVAIGNQVLNAYRNPSGVVDPKLLRTVKAFELGGMRFEMEYGLRTRQSEKAFKDWHSERKIRAALRSPIAFTELSSMMIMDVLVPRQKAFVASELVNFIYETHPNSTPEELAPLFREAINRVDARLGQVAYDRLFINNAAKATIQALVRAPGWTGGTIAEIGGAPKDIGVFIGDWIANKKAPAELPDRVAYVMSLVATSILVNGLLTKLFTGDDPEGYDYLGFRTGGTTESGKEERFVIPTYLKDLVAYKRDTAGTLIHKANPAISAITDLAQNKDWQGNQITHKGDSPLVQRWWEDVGGFSAKQFIPFWMRGVTKELERGSKSPFKLGAPLVGVMPAPSYFGLTPAEIKIQEYYKSKGMIEGRTKEQAEKYNAKKEIVLDLRKGDKVSADEKKAEARAAGIINRSDIRDIKLKASRPPIANSAIKMSYEALLEAMSVANEEELAILKKIRQTKRKNLMERGEIKRVKSADSLYPKLPYKTPIEGTPK